MGLASVFIFLLARIFYEPELALIVALAFMTYPLSLYLIKQPNVELPFLVTLYVSLWFFFLVMTKDTWNGSLSFLSGIFLGISMLIRPIAVGLPFILPYVVGISLRQIEVPKILTFDAVIFRGNNNSWTLGGMGIR